MAERESQYTIDILSAMAERTIKRLWILIILLVLLLFGSNAAWIIYEAQYTEIELSQEVEQDADGDGSNNFIGGDFYGTAESENDPPNEG